MPKTEKDIYFMLDDLQDSVCKLDMMIQGYIYAVNECTQNDRQKEQLIMTSFEVSEELEKIKKNFNSGIKGVENGNN